MNPNDFVFNSVYKGALQKGAKEPSAKDAAVLALQDYKRCNFKKISDLINFHIKQACK